MKVNGKDHPIYYGKSPIYQPIWLVVQCAHFEKNDGVRQWEGLFHVFFFENKTCLKPPTRFLVEF